MPKVKHTILEWAREMAKLSLKDAAHKLSLTDSKQVSAGEKLAAIERGDKEPSRSLLIRMSNKYHQPLLTFYLDRPPRKGDRGEDFRTLPDNFEEKKNAYVDVLVRNIKARQRTIRETLIDADEESHLGFVGVHTMDDSIASIVQTIRETLSIDLTYYRNHRTYKDAFGYIRQKVEASGVFVLLQGNLGSHHSNIDVAAFRGFALADDIAPFIVINDRDASSAFTFTLMHEMAHLVLGQTGISNNHGEKKVEQMCNRVASEFMLPQSEFEDFRPVILDFEKLATTISQYAHIQKLSSSHIAYRLYLRRDIDKVLWEKLRKYYKEKWHEHRQEIKKKNSKKDGGPNFYTVKQHKLGALVELVQRLTYSGALTTTSAGMLLDVKPLKVHRLFHTGHPA